MSRRWDRRVGSRCLPALRRPRAAALCWLGCLGILAGCLLVPGVAGRPAAVVPGGQEYLLFGGGGVRMEWEDLVGAETGTDDLGLAHFSLAIGMGNGFDCQFGANGLQGFVVLRRQVVGRAAGAERTGRFPLDLSLEAGWSVTTDPSAAELRIGPTDVHLGLTVSTPGRKVTPYFTYRHHWADRSYAYWEWSKAEIPLVMGLADGESFAQEMFFFGAEFPAPGNPEKRVAVEIYHGRPIGNEAKEAKKAERFYGFNVILSRF